MRAKAREAIFLALGAASMCWEHVDKAGVFLSEQAVKVGEDLIRRLHELEAEQDRKPE